MQVSGRVKSLRALMKENNIDAYIIPSSDYHESEYVGEYFKSRAFISGFTGSAGTVVVTQEAAGLWTDGRYFIQAKEQLKDTGIELFRSGEEGVPTIKEYLAKVLEEGSALGFDGRTLSAKEGKELAKALASKQVTVSYQHDLVGEIWEDRPEMAHSQAFLLDTYYVGVSFEEKLAKLRADMQAKKATVHVLTTLDDIAWLFNIRGRDIPYNPVLLSYAMITLEEVYLFIDRTKLGDEIVARFEKAGVTIKPYNDIYTSVKAIKATDVVLLDPAKVNYAAYSDISAQVEKIEAQNPTVLAKAIKNETELDNLRKSHLKDGVAFTKFMYWLKNNYQQQSITELSAAEQIESFREEQEGYIEPSFGAISAFKEHAAMMHYSATKETDYKIEGNGLYLLDSGGQYYDGTTDITRTIAIGDVDATLKQHFTAVVRGMINLSRAKFLQGVRGINLDILARGPIWDLGIDYKCGTGHGIGFLLNVHEAPNGFRWKMVPERNDSCELQEGMVTTNEPGIYIEGSHGIRIENELITCQGEKNEYGQFMHFEVLTYAPIDLDAIDMGEMTKAEKDYLNSYHQLVFDKVSPYLNEDEKEWLREYTREI